MFKSHLNKDCLCLCILVLCLGACSVSRPSGGVSNTGVVEMQVVLDRELVLNDLGISLVASDSESSVHFAYLFRFSKAKRHLAFELKGRLLAMGAREVRIVECQ